MKYLKAVFVITITVCTVGSAIARTARAIISGSNVIGIIAGGTTVTT